MKSLHRYEGAFKIVKWVEEVDYQLDLPPSLILAHDVFHVSVIKMYVSGASHNMEYKDLETRRVSYIEKLVKILYTKVKVRSRNRVRTKRFPILKAL